MKSRRLRKFLGISILAFGILVALGFLFYTIENRRGARAWEETRIFLEEKGVTLNPSDLRPAQVSPDENFCAIPLLASLTDFERTKKEGRSYQTIEYRQHELWDRFTRMELPYPSNYHPIQPHTPSYLDHSPFEAAPWARYLRKLKQFDPIDLDDPPLTQIMMAFASFEPDLAEIAHAAIARPEAQFYLPPSPEYSVESLGMPLRSLEGFGRLLTLRGAAALSAGDLAVARQCLATHFKLIQATETEPGLSNHLSTIQLFHLAMNLTWEGLHIHAWNEADLVWISDELQSVDFLESGDRAFRTELVSVRDTTESMKSRTSMHWDLYIFTRKNVLQKIAKSIPDGWLDQNAAHGCREVYREWLVPFENRDFSGLRRPQSDWHAAPPLHPYRYIAETVIPPRNYQFARTAHAETMQNTALTACALERFHLSNQAFPKDLKALVPNLMEAVPEDLMTGKPLIYRKTDDGSGYLIYSAGLNQKDDGGAVARHPGHRRSKGRTNIYEGDWLWTFPPGETD